MNVLFISISSLPHVSEHGISLDLIHEFRRQGHNMYIICALEKRDNQETYIAEEDGCKILRVKIGNNKRANIIEKGLTTVLLPKKYIAAIKEYYSDVKFDLVLYPTPPVTQVETVEYIKKRDGAKSYLLLKDIFPQNAVDIGMMSKSGIKGLLYKHFRRTEKKLYKVSDYIGCMSQANVDYVLKHNPEVDPNKIEVCPNSIEVIDKSVDEKTRVEIRRKYGIPLDKKIFVYGGNLGKPQDIPFIIECMKASSSIEEAFFVIVGDGSEYGKLEEYVKSANQSNLRLMQRLPKEDYDALVGACDVGLIFLDHRFTIPNFPSRLLSYMQAKIPVLSVTDPNTDIGKAIIDGGFGWWCESNNANEFRNIIAKIIYDDLKTMGKVGYKYLIDHYSVEEAYKTIINRCKEVNG
ncbi:MAG: glycosyltransferase family 4 protein [Clostridia bacterium]|nr:glycosyltransferase family 4 protein [Clostridia bacterium]